jgi:hypothetical protein
MSNYPAAFAHGSAVHVVSSLYCDQKSSGPLLSHKDSFVSL